MMRTTTTRNTMAKDESLTDQVIGILDTAIRSLNGFVPSVENTGDAINGIARTFSGGKVKDLHGHPFDTAFNQLQKLVLNSQPVELSNNPDPLTVWARQEYGKQTVNKWEVLSHLEALIICSFPICLDKSCFGDPINEYVRDNFARERPDLYLPINTREGFHQLLEQRLWPGSGTSIQTPAGETPEGNTSRPQASGNMPDQVKSEDAQSNGRTPASVHKSNSVTESTVKVQPNVVTEGDKQQTAKVAQSMLEKVRDLSKKNPGRPGSVNVLHFSLDNEGRVSEPPEELEATMEAVAQLKKEAKENEHFVTTRRRILSLIRTWPK